jgi:hypothetical protein
MTVFVDQRRLLHIGWIAGSQVHRTIAHPRVAHSFEDHGLDVRLEEPQSSSSFHRVDDRRSFGEPYMAVRFRGLRFVWSASDRTEKAVADRTTEWSARPRICRPNPPNPLIEARVAGR